MSEEQPATPGTSALAHLEGDVDRFRITQPRDVAPALEELLAVDDLLGRIVLLGGWSLDYRWATSYLLEVIAQDPAVSLELAPTILGCAIVNSGPAPDGADAILAAAFPGLTGPWRDAAADRPGVRRRLKIPDGVGYEVVPTPEPSWLWPIGKPFPPADRVEGVQARLNYLGYGAGPVNGEWNEATRRAFVRWQVMRGLTPTGELEDEAIEDLRFQTPDAAD